MIQGRLRRDDLVFGGAVAIERKFCRELASEVPIWELRVKRWQHVRSVATDPTPWAFKPVFFVPF